MIRQLLHLSVAAALALGTISIASAEVPFGDSKNVKYAKSLWKALGKAGMVGGNAVLAKPYKGQHPHGAVLDTIQRTVKVKGHEGLAIVKRNYGGDGVSVQAAANDPEKYLKAVTVMFMREYGYDEDNNNWFWAKYLPDGSLDKNPKGMQLAGRVAKGADKGCIACHAAAPGKDYRFNN